MKTLGIGIRSLTAVARGPRRSAKEHDHCLRLGAECTKASAAASGRRKTSLDIPSYRTFTVTGIGCEPGLYSGSQTLLMARTTSCRTSFHRLYPHSDGTSDTFTAWTDGVTTPLRVVDRPSAAANYYAQFKTQYQISGSVTPALTGEIGGTGYYDRGAIATLTGKATGPGCKFSKWLSHAINPQFATNLITVTGPETAQAQFACTATVSIAPEYWRTPTFDTSGAVAPVVATAVSYGDSVKLVARVTAPRGFSGSLVIKVDGVNITGAMPVSGAADAL